jgi:hypothetical protein
MLSYAKHGKFLTRTQAAQLKSQRKSASLRPTSLRSPCSEIMGGRDKWTASLAKEQARYPAAGLACAMAGGSAEVQALNCPAKREFR